jgi:hypothetical protein
MAIYSNLRTFGIIYSHLVQIYLLVIWNILPRFSISEKNLAAMN